MKKLTESFINYAKMIRLSHSVFALPFALSAALLAQEYYAVTLRHIIWILAAMVSGRSTAMGFNRILDAEWDRLNPRTAQREIPHGNISKSSAWIFTILSAVLFLVSAFQLSRICAILAMPMLGLFLFYPYAKRWTCLCHLILGLCLGLAPLGVWLAIAGSLQGPILLLGLAVLFWVAGFDVIYATVDFDFDRSHSLKSIPVRFGLHNALRLALIFHAVTLALLIWVGLSFHLNTAYFIGCFLISIAFILEHCLVTPTDLSKVTFAFNMNGFIAIFYLISLWAGKL